MLRYALAASLLFALLAPAVRAQVWMETEGGIGRDNQRFLVSGALNFGVLDGSEVENTQSASGFEVAVAYRFWGSVSAWGSFAKDTASIDGQMRSILDISVRDDSRSGTTLGDFEARRLRGGIRLDAYHDRGWQFRPYVLAAFVSSTMQIDIASVDGNVARAEVRSFEVTEQGGMVRGGVEYPVFRGAAVDVNGTFEVLEGPPGTNSLFSVATGLSYRF